jgi:phosphohistidine phosphatase
MAPSDSTRTRTIYLVRHAIAAERGDEYPDDTKRPLTRQGAAKMQKGARGFATLNPGVELILTSPLVRARRTAEILAAVLGPDAALELCDELAPGRSPASVSRTLGGYTSCHVVALVGHEPDLGELAAWLIGARDPIPMKKGGIARIEVPAFPPGRTGRLIWLATPRMLRALSKS